MLFSVVFRKTPSLNRPSSKTTPTPKATPTTVLLAPIIIKTSQQVTTSLQLDTASQTNATPTMTSTSIQASDFSGEFLELGTQTDLSFISQENNMYFPQNSSHFLSDNSNAHQSVQTNTILSSEFGTQTTLSPSLNWSEVLPRPPLGMGVSRDGSHDDDISLVDRLLGFDSEHVDFGTQTLFDDFLFNSTCDTSSNCSTCNRDTRDQESQT